MRNCSARVSPLSGLKRKSDFGAVRSVDDPGCVKTRWAKDAQNCFLNCLLPKEVASTIDSHIDEIEMEVLHASWTSEFSHSLDPLQTSIDLDQKEHAALCFQCNYDCWTGSEFIGMQSSGDRNATLYAKRKHRAVVS